MSSPKSTLNDLDAVARAIGRVKTAEAGHATRWFLAASQGQQPGCEVVLTLQCHPRDAVPAAWAELHFATQAAAVRWLATVGAWTFARQRAGRSTAEQIEATLAPLRQALQSSSSVSPSQAWLVHASGPANTVIERTAANPQDYSDQVFCGL